MGDVEWKVRTDQVNGSLVLRMRETDGSSFEDLSCDRGVEDFSIWSSCCRKLERGILKGPANEETGGLLVAILGRADYVVCYVVHAAATPSSGYAQKGWEMATSLAAAAAKGRPESDDRRLLGLVPSCETRETMDPIHIGWGRRWMSNRTFLFE